MRRRAPGGREDWTLLAIAASKGGLTPIQLQRSLHLLGKAFPRGVGPGFYEFRSINSGQFSQEIYTDAQVLANRGVVLIEVSEGEGWRHYSVTAAGLERVNQLERLVSPLALHYLRRVAGWASGRTFDQLVRGSPDSRYSDAEIPLDSRPVPPR
jgi:hypothetical protein